MYADRRPDVQAEEARIQAGMAQQEAAQQAGHAAPAEARAEAKFAKQMGVGGGGGASGFGPLAETAAEALAEYFRNQGDMEALQAVERLLRQTEDPDWQDKYVGLLTGQPTTPDLYFDYGAYRHFQLPPEMRGDSGFAPQYRDLWPSSQNQVGHFLSILDMALRYEQTGFPYNRFMVWAAVGHELEPDTWGHRAQIAAGFIKEVEVLVTRRQTLYNLFMYSDEDDLHRLLDGWNTIQVPLLGKIALVPPIEQRMGNSMEDLLLSRKAFELAALLLKPDSPLQTAEDVANWLQANLLPPGKEEQP